MTKWWQVCPSQPKSQPSNPQATRGEAKGAWYAKTLLKDKTEGSSAPYRFDVLAQLANIPARITLYKLLRLSKSTRKLLKKL